MRIAHIQQIAHVHKPQHIIEILANHRIARIRLIAHERRRLVDGIVTIEERHIGARPHNFRYACFRRAEHILQNHTLVLRQVRVCAHEHSQLVIAHFALRLVGVESHETYQKVRVMPDEPDDGRADCGEGIDCRHDRPGDRFGFLQSDALRGQFGNNDGEIRDDKREHDHRHRAGKTLRHASRDKQRGDIGRDCRCAERCGKEAGKRHAQLHSRQEPVGVARHSRHTRPAGILQFHLLNLRASQRHQRHLRAREHTAKQHEHENKQHIEPNGHTSNVTHPFNDVLVSKLLR